MRKNYSVWKIGRNGEYSRLIKAYSQKGHATNRADSEAEDEIRSGVTYIVTVGTGRKANFEDVPASRVGMDGFQWTGNAEYVAEE